ncbi:hypothetical protein [Rhizobium leucaenae]|uniref:hypothetical protein n=1 Tax=Rhizobium leucaenae TaxID=29450 RepID=UPI001FD8C87A|nr:hypothetical protein [Rhizobium leucaenae]
MSRGRLSYTTSWDMIILHCRMTPLRATKPRGEVIGALVVVHEVGAVSANMLVA